MKRMYSDLLKRAMVSIISLSMIIQPVVPVMAAESTDAQDIEVGGSESEAVSTDAEDLYTDADMDADMEAVNDEESLSEVSGVEEDVETAETEMVEDMEEALDAAGDEEDVNGDAAIHVFDMTQLVNKGVLAVGEYTDNCGMTIPGAKTSADEDKIGYTKDGAADPFFTIWAHNSESQADCLHWLLQIRFLRSGHTIRPRLPYPIPVMKELLSRMDIWTD